MISVSQISASRVRWLGYAAAAALTVAAMVWVNEDASVETVLPATPRPGGAAAPGAGAAGPSPLSLSTVVVRPGDAPLADPFAVGTGLLPETATQAAARRATVAAGPPVAPPLPFSYLGRWQEDGKTFYFLQRGDRSYKVAGPGELDGDYAVQAVDDQRIALKYLPLGIVQDLRLDAPVHAPRQQAVAAPPEPPANEPQTGN